MKRLRVALALALSAAYGIGLLASLRSPDAAPPAETPVAPPPAPSVTLHCVMGQIQKRRIPLTFSGTASFPDGTVLKLQLWRFREENRLGKIETSLLAAGTGFAEIADGKFTHEDRVVAPGIYRVVVSLDENLQDRAIVTRIQGRIPARPREFDFPLWDDGFLPHLLDERGEFESLIFQVGHLYTKMADAAATEHTWNRRGAELLGEAERLQGLSESAGDLRALYPAALQDLGAAARLMTFVPTHFFWTLEGNFGGAFNLPTGSWVTGPDGQPFSFKRMHAFLAKTLDVAHREYSLWMVKEARRVYGGDAVLLAARSNHRDIRKMLLGMEAGLDRIEAQLRGEARAEPVEQPQDPPQFTRWKKLEEARKILRQADELWHQLGDRQSPGLYQRLMKDYNDELDPLQARVRVHHRAWAENQ